MIGGAGVESARPPSARQAEVLAALQHWSLDNWRSYNVDTREQRFRTFNHCRETRRPPGDAHQSVLNWVKS
jgi:hypothetical protein